jgi:hypothetical protein
MPTRGQVVALLVAVVVAVVAFLAGWSVRDAIVSGHADWAATIGTVAAWAGDAGKIALGALIGAVGAWIVARMNRTESKVNREDAAQARDQAREDARQARHLDRKVALYTDLWLDSDRHKREVAAQISWRRDPSKGQDPGIGSSESAYRAYFAVRLLAPSDVVDAAFGLYLATEVLGEHHAYVAREGEPPAVPDENLWKEDLAAWARAARKFEQAAAQDLLGTRDGSSRREE